LLQKSIYNSKLPILQTILSLSQFREFKSLGDKNWEDIGLYRITWDEIMIGDIP